VSSKGLNLGVSRGKNTVIKPLWVLCSRRFLLFLLRGQPSCMSGVHPFSWAGTSGGTATPGADLGWSQELSLWWSTLLPQPPQLCYQLEIRGDL